MLRLGSERFFETPVPRFWVLLPPLDLGRLKSSLPGALRTLIAGATAGPLTRPPLPRPTPAPPRQVGTCLLQNCQLALAKCVGDVECLEDLVCLNLCNDADDEVACQVGRGGEEGGGIVRGMSDGWVGRTDT